MGRQIKASTFSNAKVEPAVTHLVSHLANFSEIIAVGVNHDGIRVTVDNIETQLKTKKNKDDNDPYN